MESKKLQKQPAQRGKSDFLDAKRSSTSKTQKTAIDSNTSCSSLEAIASGVSLKDALKNTKRPVLSQSSPLKEGLALKNGLSSQNDASCQKDAPRSTSRLSTITSKNSRKGVAEGVNLANININTNEVLPTVQNDPRYLEQRKHGTRIFPIDCHHWKSSNSSAYNIWHWHPEIEIMHLIKGRGYEIEFVDRRFIVDAPAILVVPSRVLHRGVSAPLLDVCIKDGQANYTMFDPSILEMSRFDEALNNTLGILESPLSNLSTPILASDAGFAELENILKFIEDFAKDKDAGIRLQVKGCLLQFLGVLHRYGYLNTHHIERPRLRTKDAQEERIKEIFDYINSNYNRPISIIDVASRLGISKQYFCRLFRRFTNMSFVEYLNLVRLNNAAQDILLSDTSINEIAEKHGFDSISYFFKVFKLQFNCTPNTFRQSKGVVRHSNSTSTKR